MRRSIAFNRQKGRSSLGLDPTDGTHNFNLWETKELLARSVLSWLSVLTLLPGTTVAQSIEESEPPPAIAPKISQVLPANLAGAILFDTTGTWSDLERFNPLPFEISGPGGIPFLPLETDFNSDIQPWVGKWAATVLLPARDPYGLDRTDLEASLLTLVSASDTVAMNAYLEKLETLRGAPPVEREFEGVKIWEWEADEFSEPEFLTPEPNPLPGLPEDMGMKGAIVGLTKALPAALSDAFSKRFEGNIFDRLAQAKPKPRIQPQPPIPGSPPNSEFEEPPALEPLPEPFPEPSEFPPFPIPRPGLAIAVLPDGYLAASTNAAALEQLIALQADLVPLADNPQFQKTFEHPEFDRSLVSLYGNLKQLSQLAATLNFTDFPPIPNEPETVNFLTAVLDPIAKEYTTIHSWGWGDLNGLRTQSVAYYRNPNPSRATVAPVGGTQIASQIPGASYLSVNSFNLARYWQRILDTTATEPEFQEGLDEIRRLVRENLNLDLESELISLFDGEYAFFLFPTQQGLFPFFNPGLDLGLGITIETSNRPGMEQLLSQIETWIETSGEDSVDITTAEVEGMTATSLNTVLPDGQSISQVAYSWNDTNTLTLSTGIGPLAELLPQPYGTLDESYTFQTAIEPFPIPNDGYFFLNMGSLLSFLNNFFSPGMVASPDDADWIRIAMGAFRSLSVSSFSTPELEQADFYLVLSPATEKIDLGDEWDMTIDN
ncbi:MAG: DUF3352 domain-containing protein [Cyanobacteriota bacterium]|nr:DUF3352 domain-containing protein [Cyanobacteriota bacterium]